MPTNVRRFGALVRTDGGLLVPAGAATGKILTSDAEGNATWGLRHPELDPVRLATAVNQAALEGLKSIDGVVVAAGDRVLLTGQTEKKNNGIWVAAEGAWTRPTDFPTGGEITTSRTVAVLVGATWAQTSWCIKYFTGTLTIGTTEQEWGELKTTNVPNIAWEEVEALSSKLGKQGAPYSESIAAAVYGGLVFVAGVVKVTEEALSKSILFTLPPACRPNKQQQVLVGDNAGAGTHNLTVKTTGEVEAIAAIKTTISPLSLNFFFRRVG